MSSFLFQVIFPLFFVNSIAYGAEEMIQNAVTIPRQTSLWKFSPVFFEFLPHDNFILEIFSIWNAKKTIFVFDWKKLGNAL